MTKSKEELRDLFIPKAILLPITKEAKESVINTKIDNKLIPISKFPFKVGRESRMGENERGLFIKLRIMNNFSQPNNDIYLIDNGKTLEISKEHFQIEEKDDLYFLKDRNSTLGTKLNDIEIGKENSKKLHELKDGDIIKIGSKNSLLQFQFLILK